MKTIRLFLYNLLSNEDFFFKKLRSPFDFFKNLPCSESQFAVQQFWKNFSLDIIWMVATHFSYIQKNDEKRHSEKKF